MLKKEHQDSPKYELDEYDKAHINDVFVENMTEKLRKKECKDRVSELQICRRGLQTLGYLFQIKGVWF